MSYKRIWTKGTIIRAYSSSGLYWAGSCSFSDSVYGSDGNFVLTACAFDPELNQDENYSEFDDIIIEEIRIISALTLSIDNDGGMVLFRPLSRALAVGRDFDFNDPDIISEFQRILMADWASNEPSPWEGPYPDGSGIYPYKFHGKNLPIEITRRIYEKIDINDPLLMRGLRTLVRAVALSSHPVFFEEANYSLYVSMDATFEIFRRILISKGIKSPTSYDVSDYLKYIFNEDFDDSRYFEDYYDNRIMAIHPASRLGSSYYMPGSKGDQMWLFKDLREIYRYLILGEILKC